MLRLRSTITAIITLALAGVPVPAAAMHAAMIAIVADSAVPEAANVHDHCCEHAGTCDKHTNKACDASGACALLCAPLSANVVAEIRIPPLAAPSLMLVMAAEGLNATAPHPALPPPRL